MALSDPPVYVSVNNNDWKLCAPTTSEFLAAILVYEAAFAFDYSSEEFFLLSEKDLKLMQSRLTQLPYALHNWMECTITCYSNAPDNLAIGKVNIRCFLEEPQKSPTINFGQF